MKYKMNPMFLKELKTSVRSRKIASTILIYDGLLALIGLIVLYVVFQETYDGLDGTSILLIYCIVAFAEFMMLIFVIPAYTASAISGERERQTLEILLTTTMKPRQIINGKLMSSIGMVLLLVFSSLPILSLIFTIGGISALDILEYLALVVVTAIYVGSIGMLYSVLVKKTTISTVLTYVTLAILGIGTVIILFVVYLYVNDKMYRLYRNGITPTLQDTDLGYLPTILFINPGMSILTLLFGQAGSTSAAEDIIGNICSMPKFITRYWTAISMGIQLAISGLLLHIASNKLDPLKRKEKHDRKKRTVKQN